MGRENVWREGKGRKFWALQLSALFCVCHAVVLSRIQRDSIAESDFLFRQNTVFSASNVRSMKIYSVCAFVCNIFFAACLHCLGHIRPEQENCKLKFILSRSYLIIYSLKKSEHEVTVKRSWVHNSLFCRLESFFFLLNIQFFQFKRWDWAGGGDEVVNVDREREKSSNE